MYVLKVEIDFFKSQTFFKVKKNVFEYQARGNMYYLGEYYSRNVEKAKNILGKETFRS